MARKSTPWLKALGNRRVGGKDKARLRLMRKNRMNEWKEFLREDDDFDYESVLEVLRFKLDRLRRHIVAHGLIKDAPKVAREIKEVLVLLDKVIKDDYSDVRTKAFMRKHGLKFKFGISSHGKFQTGIPDELSREYLTEMEAAFEDRKGDLKKAFDLTAENIWAWWD